MSDTPTCFFLNPSFQSAYAQSATVVTANSRARTYLSDLRRTALLCGGRRLLARLFRGSLVIKSLGICIVVNSPVLTMVQTGH